MCFFLKNPIFNAKVNAFFILKLVYKAVEIAINNYDKPSFYNVSFHAT